MRVHTLEPLPDMLMPIVKKYSSGNQPELFDMTRLPNLALMILMTLCAAIVILCVEHLTGHLLHFIPDDTGSAFVGVMTGVVIGGRCAWIIVQRALNRRQAINAEN
ncbi:TPA: hypothetical protein ACYLN4_000703 [Burkholderia lata]